MRIACGVEYDGAGFHGWQRQPRARTVQAELERALGSVANAPVSLVCAGRTDAGVHATGQVAHFDTAAERSPPAWLMGTNSNLPPEIAVRWAQPVASSFHARRSTGQRHYRYLIAQGKARSALWRQRAGWLAQPLDTQAVHSAAQRLVCEHDFSAFRAAGCQAAHAWRRIDRITVQRRGDWVVVDVAGNAFLHHMVRILVGTLVRVGLQDRPCDWVGEVLAAGDRCRAGATAAASGLYFLGPSYPQDTGVPPPRGDAAFPPGMGGAESQAGNVLD